MPGKFHYRNQSQRFDLYSFYSLITKCKIVELLDKDGHTPFDSDTMNDSVYDYAVQIYKDILDNGIVSYFDSDSFRHDSDGDGSNSWNGITRNVATAKVYEPLRKWLYSQSGNGGLDNTSDEITPGFNRRYYSLPVSDSDGTIRHVNVYSFLKSHFNRWLQFDPYERHKLTTNILSVIEQDSEISSLFAQNFVRAVEEDSDLSRRMVELYSNVMQTDSEVRNEVLRTAITALSGLKPGGDSDAARALTEIISSVYETDSDVRNEFGDHILLSLQNDSDQQTELGDILSSTDIPLINADDLITRNLLPMDGDDSGTIGDPYQRWSYGNFSTTRTDDLIPTNIQASQVVTVSSDSDSKLVGSNNLKFLNDSDDPLLYKGLRHIAIDSDTFFNLLVENETWYTLDSDGVRSTILDTPVKSEYSWFIGQRGDVYVIGEDPPDSEIIVVYDSDNLSNFFAPSHGNLLNWTTNGTYGPTITMWSNPGSNDFREANTTKPGGFQGHWEIEFAIGGYGWHGFAMFPTSAAAEASNEWLYTQPGGTYSHVQNINIPNYVHFTCYFQNGHQATTGLAYVAASVSGTTGTTLQPQVNGTNPTAQWYGASYPLFYRIGRDSQDRVYVRIRGQGISGTQDDLSPKYYVDATTKNLSTSAYNAVTISGGIQFGWGNYDNGQPEVITNISLTNTITVVNKINTLETKKLVYTSQNVVDTQAELTRARNDVITKQQVFNSWYRFNHGRGSGGGTPGVFNYPFDQNQMTYGWAYSAATDTIFTTINSSNFSGFVSTDVYQDFGFDSIVKAHYTGPGFINYDPVINGSGGATTSYAFDDDDAVINIVAFTTTGIFGQPGYRENTLSVIRTAGGFPTTSDGTARTAWCLFYNYQQDDGRLLIDGRNFGTASTGIQYPGIPWKNFPNGSKVMIRRKGDIIRAYCSQMNDASYTIDSDTELYWDLASDSDTLKFRGPVRYGYGAHSQLGSNWSSIVFAPTEGKYLHNLVSNPEYSSSSGGNVYQYDLDYAVWNMDSELTIDSTAGERLLHNEDTHKTFYNDPVSDTTIQVMTARKFTDVFNLPPLSAAPDSDTLGRMGLRPNTFAMADGVSWDPGSLSGTTPYPVFYNGTAWLYFSLL